MTFLQDDKIIKYKFIVKVETEYTQCAKMEINFALKQRSISVGGPDSVNNLSTSLFAQNSSG